MSSASSRRPPSGTRRKTTSAMASPTSACMARIRCWRPMAWMSRSPIGPTPRESPRPPGRRFARRFDGAGHDDSARCAWPSRARSCRGPIRAAYAHPASAPAAHGWRPHGLMHRIHLEFEFEPGATTVTTSVDEVLELKRGVCQDFAHLMIACLRSHGLAARYVWATCSPIRRLAGRGCSAPTPPTPGSRVFAPPRLGRARPDQRPSRRSPLHHARQRRRLRRCRAAARRDSRRQRPDDEGRGQRHSALKAGLTRAGLRRVHGNHRPRTPDRGSTSECASRPLHSAVGGIVAATRRRETSATATEALDDSRIPPARARSRRHEAGAVNERGTHRDAGRPRLVRIELGPAPRPRGARRERRRRRLAHLDRAASSALSEPAGGLPRRARSPPSRSSSTSCSA